MPNGFFIKDFIRHWIGDAWPAVLTSGRFGRLRQAWVVNTRRNLCGGSSWSAELTPLLPLCSFPPPSPPDPELVPLCLRSDPLLKSNSGDEDIFLCQERPSVYSSSTPDDV